MSGAESSAGEEARARAGASVTQLSDTDCRDGSGHYSVIVWNAEHTGYKIWKNLATEAEANAEAAALKVHKFEVAILKIGEPAA